MRVIVVLPDEYWNRFACLLSKLPYRAKFTVKTGVLRTAVHWVVRLLQGDCKSCHPVNRREFAYRCYSIEVKYEAAKVIAYMDRTGESCYAERKRFFLG